MAKHSLVVAAIVPTGEMQPILMWQVTAHMAQPPMVEIHFRTGLQ